MQSAVLLSLRFFLKRFYFTISCITLFYLLISFVPGSVSFFLILSFLWLSFFCFSSYLFLPNFYPCLPYLYYSFFSHYFLCLSFMYILLSNVSLPFVLCVFFFNVSSKFFLLLRFHWFSFSLSLFHISVYCFSFPYAFLYQMSFSNISLS